MVDTFQVTKFIEEMSEFMETFMECMQEFKTRGQGKFSQSEAVEGLYFVETIVSGFSMESLVEMGVIHNFLSE